MLESIRSIASDDDLAQELGVAKRGKTECWYIIGDGGELYQGTPDEATADSFRQAMDGGDVKAIEAQLNRFETNVAISYSCSNRSWDQHAVV